MQAQRIEDRTGTGRPTFDDDPTLSVILSKAFLLAADRRITESTILSQIDRG